MTSFVERIFCADTTSDKDSWMQLIKKVSDELRKQHRPSPSLYDTSETQETPQTTTGYINENEDKQVQNMKQSSVSEPEPEPRAAPRKPKPKQKVRV